jgi:hypothetical protein
MARRRSRQRRRPPHRKEPSDVEMEARRRAAMHPSMLDSLPDEALTLAEEIRDQVALIQSRWDPTTEWLRSIGVTYVPHGPSRKQFIDRLRANAAWLPPLVRVFPIDRPLISYTYWLQQDIEEGLPPDELAAEVERAMQSVRGLWVGASSTPDDGAMPTPDAIPLGPAQAWEDAPDWLYTTYRLEAPLDAGRAQRFDVSGDVVLRVDEQGRSFFVRGPRRRRGLLRPRRLNPADSRHAACNS